MSPHEPLHHFRGGDQVLNKIWLSGDDAQALLFEKWFVPYVLVVTSTLKPVGIKAWVHDSQSE